MHRGMSSSLEKLESSMVSSACPEGRLKLGHVDTFFPFFFFDSFQRPKGSKFSVFMCYSSYSPGILPEMFALLAAELGCSAVVYVPIEEYCEAFSFKVSLAGFSCSVRQEHERLTTLPAWEPSLDRERRGVHRRHSVLSQRSQDRKVEVLHDRQLRSCESVLYSGSRRTLHSNVCTTRPGRRAGVSGLLCPSSSSSLRPPLLFCSSWPPSAASSRPPHTPAGGRPTTSREPQLSRNPGNLSFVQLRRRLSRLHAAALPAHVVLPRQSDRPVSPGGNVRLFWPRLADQFTILRTWAAVMNMLHSAQRTMLVLDSSELMVRGFLERG